MTDSEARIVDLSSRVAHLESRYRVCRWLAAAGTLGLAALALMGQGPVKGIRSVETDRLVLRDRAGKVRATLEVDRADIAAFTLNDGSGKNLVRLWVSSDGTTGVTLDERERAQPEGPALADMTARSFRVGQVLRGYVALNARNADPFLKLVGERSEAVLGRTELTKTRTGGSEIRPAASLIFFDMDGKVSWSAP